MRFGIIGAGVVGTALAVKLENAGYECLGVNTRSPSSYERFRRYLNKEHLPLEILAPEADFLFITTQDGMIHAVAEVLTDRRLYKPGQIWIHCSGSLRSAIMRIDENLPVKYLSLHPLQAFADVEQALTLLKGTHFGIEGDAKETGEEITRALGGIPHHIKAEAKPLYHAGAVMASNYLVTLAAAAVRLFTMAGVEEKAAIESLLPLMRGTLQNLGTVGLPQALTGPIARGDYEVVRSHLESMPMKLAEIYRSLGLFTLEIGQAKQELNGSKYSDEVWQELNSLLAKSGI